MKQTAETAAALLIGNELLSGKVRDENLYTLAQTLRSVGVRLSRAAFVEDQRELVSREVNALRQSHDLVVTSGGVGPTHDDVTLESVADAFGVEAVEHPRLAQLLKDFYQSNLTEGHLRMALVPDGAELVTSDDIRWPTVRMGNVWILPGVPEIFRMKLLVLRSHIQGPRAFVTGAVFVQLEEGAIKAHLDQVVAACPDVEVGSYPKLFDKSYKTKVTFDGPDADSVRQAADLFCSLLPEGEPQRRQ